MTRKRAREAVRPKVAIVCLYAYPLFNPECESPFGGSEVRVSLIAKSLAALGTLDVEVVVFDHDQPSVETIDGVTIKAWPGMKCPIPTRKPRGLAAGQAATHAILKQASTLSLVSRAARLWRRWTRPEPSPESILTHIGPEPVLEKNVSFFRVLDADLYMMPGNSRVSAELVSWCRIEGRPYVMLSGSDGDFHPDYKQQPEAAGIYGLPGYIMNTTIDLASAHVVQNARQAELLRASWSREAKIVRNPIDLSRIYPKDASARDILWIGKSDWIKRPGLFLDLAERFPELSFRMLMTFSNKEIWDECHARAAKLPNLTLVDYTPFNEVEKLFASSRLLVSTSVFEGFPNAFLQAAKYGLPIVSLVVDPDGMLAVKECGAACGDDWEKMAAELSSFATDNDRFKKASQAIENYVRVHHEKSAIAREYEKVLTEVLMASGRGSLSSPAVR
ncbi:MAG: glycosyltransferase family 4 protein [Vicinamibacteria bacterium]